MPVPDWLAHVSIEARPPMAELLEGSVYYPACGFDGRPVQYIAGYSHSFIYVDYGCPAKEVVAALAQDQAFLGYRLVGARFLDSKELIGPCAVQQIELDRKLDGDPNRCQDHWVDPYAYWAVFERDSDLSAAHGPHKFSLIYIAGDGVVTYQNLYFSYRARPSVVAIIQPGESFGFNWTNFYQPTQIFARTVSATERGGPRYLLIGGRGASKEFQQHIRWPQHGDLLRFWKSSDGYLALWKHSAKCSQIDG